MTDVFIHVDDAVPMRRDFRVPTCWAMRIIVQRRFGLPLDEALASGEPTCTVRGGRAQDPMGDSASNIGRAGHNQRHQQTVCCGTACAHHMQGVWGTLWSRWSRRITSATRTTTGSTSLGSSATSSSGPPLWQRETTPNG